MFSFDGKLGHGGDYNPDQWLDRPDILAEDIRLMKLAGCNLMSVGIFAWSALEPQEGVYTFDWLKNVLDTLHENGISAFLATPSGARPAWMSQKYPEVLRVQEDGSRILHGDRHNHCYTSPVYRRFVRKMNTALAETFGHHPAVVGWHVSNEYGGMCHCELCQAEFRNWLKARYGTLDALNAAWWTGFWSKRYTDWSQLHGPTSMGETQIHGLNLDWMRFVTDRTIDFYQAEVEPLKQTAPHLPVTTNMHSTHMLDYFKFRHSIDFAAYDAYPDWGMGADDVKPAEETGFKYDMMRSLKDGPWVLMESTPSQVNWKPICRPKKPGMHLLASMQAVAHGADSVMYFQWRKSRGASEKLHGAVVDHEGSERTRVFREVAETGEALKKLACVSGASVPKQAALLFDYENFWAQEDAQGPKRNKEYAETLYSMYGAMKQAGLAVDIIDETYDLAPYAVVAAPQLYLVKPGVEARLKAFVQGGGVLVSTYFSGIADEHDLVTPGGWPGNMRDLFGVWDEETDPLPEGAVNAGIVAAGSILPEGRYRCGYMCGVVHAEGAETIAVYADDYYAGMPCITRNRWGNGYAWYLASRFDRPLLVKLFGELAREAGLSVTEQPYGVHTDIRVNENGRFTFVQNYAAQPVRVTLPTGVDVLTGAQTGGEAELPVHGIRIIQSRTDD